MNNELFKSELTAVVRKKIASLKRQGTVGMGRENLWGLCAGDISRNCPNAPVGTNAAYFARQTFDEIVAHNKFVY